MNNFFEDLKKYFEVTPREKVLENWAKSEEFDKIGPTVEDFLNNTNKFYQLLSEEPIEACLVGINEYDPKFTSGFFMSNKNISVCKLPHFQ